MPEKSKKWERRLLRARELGEKFPFARQILLFYTQLTAFQKGCYLELLSATRVTGILPMGGDGRNAPGSSRNGGRSALPVALHDADLGRLLARWPAFLSMVESEAPAALAASARGLAAGGSSAGARLLRAAWPAPGSREAETTDVEEFLSAERLQHSGREACGTSAAPEQQPVLEPCERFCAGAFLQPFAEFLADHANTPAPRVRRPTCPYCGSLPLLGVLRPEGDGAKRSLLCSFCRTEWDYLRIACHVCGERREEKLCVYTTPRFKTVRVEACATCMAYINTADLTYSGLAVPEVDELAALPLSLWADENGYHKVAPNILGF